MTIEAGALSHPARPRWSTRDKSVADPTVAWIAAVAAILALWLAVRWLFYLGLAGSDDLHHLRFALAWDHAPTNHWEARLLTNALVWLSVQVLGFSEPAVTLPSGLGALGLLACILAWCGQHHGLRAMLYAGLLMALLPIDVGLATTVSATPIMSALVALGTILFLEGGRSRAARFLAPLCLALGVVTHLAALYYVAALCGAALVLDRRLFLRPVLWTIIAGLAVLAAEVLVFWLVYHDPLLPYRVAAEQSAALMPLAPTTPDGRFGASFILWPIEQVFFSQAFGIALLVAAALGVWQWRRLDTPHRVLLLTAGLFWLWMSFGTQVPWGYHPFHRLTRFWHPLCLMVAVLLAAGIGSARGGWAAIARPTILAGCALSLACAGSWGQNVHVSRELLAYARTHPATCFGTDRKTLYEMQVLSALRPPPNIVGLPQAARAAEQNDGGDRFIEALLVNPLNLRRDSRFADFVAAHGGAVLYETQPVYRDICRAIPPLRRLPWALRKPAARVQACMSGPLDPVGPNQATGQPISASGR